MSPIDIQQTCSTLRTYNNKLQVYFNKGPQVRNSVVCSHACSAFSPLPSYLDTDVLGAPVAAPPSLVASLRTLSPIVERAVRHSHSLAWSTQQMAKSVREVVFHTKPPKFKRLFPLGIFKT